MIGTIIIGALWIALFALLLIAIVIPMLKFIFNRLAKYIKSKFPEKPIYIFETINYEKEERMQINQRQQRLEKDMGKEIVNSSNYDTYALNYSMHASEKENCEVPGYVCDSVLGISDDEREIREKMKVVILGM